MPPPLLCHTTSLHKLAVSVKGTYLVHKQQIVDGHELFTLFKQALSSDWEYCHCMITSVYFGS